jgi:hypothetical protein
VGLGFAIGCWGLGIRPHWPPREDQDRLLLFLFPLLIGVELVATIPARRRWLAWLPRLVVAVGAAPVLLHNSIYLTDLAGPGSREWTPAQTGLILGGLAVGLLGVWGLLALLARRTCRSSNHDAGEREPRAGGRSIALAVAVACAGAAVTVMLSGYASGGQLGLPLAAALAGVLLASLALSYPPNVEGILSLGVVGLFAVLLIGRFFGTLTDGNAALLFFGLLLCWVPEAKYIRRLGPRPRSVLRVVAVALPVFAALTLAQQKFAGDSTKIAPDSREPSLQDYEAFGK